MSLETKKYVRFGIAVGLIVVALGYLAYTGVQESKSYYVTVKEMRAMGDEVYSRKLRVGGNVQPGSIKTEGPHVDFILVENDDKLNVHEKLHVIYKGNEPPPDTFKDDAQALAIGVYKRDGVFYANELQAKCASKYGTPQPGTPGAPAAPAAQQPQSKGY